jgi:hypothetical protein
VPGEERPVRDSTEQRHPHGRIDEEDEEEDGGDIPQGGKAFDQRNEHHLETLQVLDEAEYPHHSEHAENGEVDTFTKMMKEGEERRWNEAVERRGGERRLKCNSV